MRLILRPRIDTRREILRSRLIFLFAACLRRRQPREVRIFSSAPAFSRASRLRRVVAYRFDFDSYRFIGKDTRSDNAIWRKQRNENARLMHGHMSVIEVGNVSPSNITILNGTHCNDI
jgi:hypothetical protein